MFEQAFTKTKLTIFLAIFLVATGNRAFFQHVAVVYPWHGNAGFLVSLSLFLFSILVLLISMFNLVMSVRVVAGVFLVLASVAGYFSDQLGIVIDTGMIQNILETDASEASDLVSGGLVLRILLLGILPALMIWFLPLESSGWLRELRFTIQTGIAAFALMLLCVLSVSDQYASFFREHKVLRYYTNPATPIYSMGKYIAKAIKSDAPEEFVTLTASAATPENDAERELIIVVVGETARADHFSLNGYSRETNPLLARQDRLVSFSQATSCGTNTAISVPCLFGFAGRSEFDAALARYTENVLDVLAKAGVNIIWWDNNSSSKGVAERIPYQNFRLPELNPVCDTECRDVGMLVDLQEYIESQEGDILIILHQMGSHGPAYFKRYPPEYEKFKPTCRTQELSDCTQEEIINAYDNSLLYTDYFLSKVIELLKANTPQYETAMFYISDHGESLGENGLYLHGMPYLFAPEAQTHVPVVAWIGSSSDIDYERMLARKDIPVSHDVFSFSLLEAFEVEAEFYKEPNQKDLLFHMKRGDHAH